jgi:hypothetical protein
MKFSSVVSIQNFGLKNANPSFNEIHVENDYFPLPSKFKMHLPPRKTAINAMWIFKTKTGPTGSIKKLKARIVAKRNKQEAGMDFYATFAPVVCWSTIRSILALAVRKQWSLRCLDVITAF